MSLLSLFFIGDPGPMGPAGFRGEECKIPKPGPVENRVSLGQMDLQVCVCVWSFGGTNNVHKYNLMSKLDSTATNQEDKL